MDVRYLLGIFLLLASRDGLAAVEMVGSGTLGV